MPDQNPQNQAQSKLVQSVTAKESEGKKQPAPIKPASKLFEEQNQKARDAFIYAQFAKKRKTLVGVIGEYYLNQMIDGVEPTEALKKIHQHLVNTKKARLAEFLLAQMTDFERVKSIFKNRKEAKNKHQKEE